MLQISGTEHPITDSSISINLYKYNSNYERTLTCIKDIKFGPLYNLRLTFLTYRLIFTITLTYDGHNCLLKPRRRMVWYWVSILVLPTDLSHLAPSSNFNLCWLYWSIFDLKANTLNENDFVLGKIRFLWNWLILKETCPTWVDQKASMQRLHIDQSVYPRRYGNPRCVARLVHLHTLR